MSQPGHVSEWRGTSASLRGSSHGAEGINQDAVRIELLSDATAGPTWVAAVADGHGGVRYVRSDTGAQVAVTVAVEEVRRLLADGHALDAALLRGAGPRIVEAWRAGVLAHYAEHPFTEEESGRAGAALADNPLVAYGATLLVAVIGDTGVLLAQIGDGDALVRTHGFAVRPVPGDARLVANETTSLCMDTAADDFRFAELPGSAEVDLVMLSSDGYGNSFAATDWWHKLVGDLAWYVDVHGFDAFSERLPEWLAESALVGGDDVTAAVLTRPLSAHVPTPVLDPPVSRTLVEEPVDQAGSQPPEPPELVTPVPAQRRRRGLLTGLLAGLLVVGLVVGAVFVGARLLGTDAAPTDGVTPSESSTPSSTPSTPGDGVSTPPNNPPVDPGPRGGEGPQNPPGGGTKNGGTKDGGDPKP